MRKNRILSLKKLIVVLLLSMVFARGTLSISVFAAEVIPVEGTQTCSSEMTLIDSTDDSDTYRLTLFDSSNRSFYHLDIQLTGNTTNHSVTATVTNDHEIGTNTIEVTLQLYSTKYNTTLRATFYVDDLDLGESISATHYNVNQTEMYYAVVSGTANGTPFSRSSPHIPFNKIGKKYPTNITSPVTGQSLPYNISVTAQEIPSSQWVPWNSTIRAQYEAYLGVSLTGYDVHHILPRRYGGTNDYSNLIPLRKSDHSKVTSWWNKY